MAQLTQPRTKEYTRKVQQVRGTIQSQNRGRFVEEIDENYMVKLGGRKNPHSGNNYQSPVQLREMGLSQ